MKHRGAGAIGVIAIISCALSAAAPPVNPSILTSTERAAVTAYLAELQAKAGNDPIVDPDSPSIRDRIDAPGKRKMITPEVPPNVRNQHGHGQVVVAGVIEADGRVSNAKVVSPSGYPSFDQVALAAVAKARYEKPATLDGKPIRCFIYVPLYFEVS
jgi:TonB family protein